MCLYPRLLDNPKYKATKKNGGNIPPVFDDRVKKVPIGCQVCIECRKQKANGWRTRLMEDIKHNKGARFITLTFSNESIKQLNDALHEKECKEEGYDLDNAIATLAVKRFLDRYYQEHKYRLRHWFVTEIGHEGTENIHIHGLIWSTVTPKEIEHIWKYGWTWEGTFVNEKTINYIVKYVMKVDRDHLNYKPVILTSPGIGGGYTKNTLGDWTRNKYNGENTNELYRLRTGKKVTMPIYWRNKIYSEEDRERLWIQKIDKQERYILGQKIDISQGDEEYYRALEWARRYAIELGHATPELTWEKEQYERERRMLKQKERIENKKKKNNKKKGN